MTGESVGVVVESKSDKYIVGEYLCVHQGWQTYIVANDENPALFKADPSIVPLSTYLLCCSVLLSTCFLCCSVVLSSYWL